MPTAPTAPLIVISYARADEPKKPAQGEIQWRTFVTRHLRRAAENCAIDVRIKRLKPVGKDWDFEIERKLGECDIFVLLVSPNSLSSDTRAGKEVAIIRERQMSGEGVHFYPVLLTSTPDSALDNLRDGKLRPRDGRPLSDYSLDDRDRQMRETADEIAQIAAQIAARGNGPRTRSPPLAQMSQASPPSARPQAKKRGGARPEINDQESLEAWLKGQSPEVAAAIAARAALRVAPLMGRAARKARVAKEVSAFLVLTSAMFRAGALARVAAKYPARANELRAAAQVADARAAAAAAVPFVAGGVHVGSAAAVIAAAGAAADAAAGASPLGEPASAPFAAPLAAADAAVRDEIRFDASALRKSDARRLADLPLWSRGVPDWMRNEWEGLKAELPTEENWDVWTDWYDDRLRGGSRGEAHELVFASAPSEVCEKGPAAANAWIKDRLPRSLENSSPPALPPPRRGGT